MQELNVKQKQYLKGLAHDLQPVVTIGNNGLTPAVIKEIEVNLMAHELIKIRVTDNEKDKRELIIQAIVNDTKASFVQHIGKLLIFYRTKEKAKITLPNKK